MQARRSWLLALSSGCVALAVLVVPALAAEVRGRVRAVNPDARKVVVTEQGTAQDVELRITDATVFELPGGGTPKRPLDLSRLRKGALVVVTHEGGVASKIALRKGEGD
jgi:hypothetical protein